MEYIFGIAGTIVVGVFVNFLWHNIAWWWKSRSKQDEQNSRDEAFNKSRIDEIILTADPTNDWDVVHDGPRTITTYNHDSNLRFEIDYSDAGVHSHAFNEQWATQHLDHSATSYWCNLYYGASLMNKFVLVSVDGGRALLPMPKKHRSVSYQGDVLPLEYKVAQIHDKLGRLDEYMQRSNLRIYASE